MPTAHAAATALEAATAAMPASVAVTAWTKRLARGGGEQRARPRAGRRRAGPRRGCAIFDVMTTLDRRARRRRGGRGRPGGGPRMSSRGPRCSRSGRAALNISARAGPHDGVDARHEGEADHDGGLGRGAEARKADNARCAAPGTRRASGDCGTGGRPGGLQGRPAAASGPTAAIPAVAHHEQRIANSEFMTTRAVRRRSATAATCHAPSRQPGGQQGRASPSPPRAAASGSRRAATGGVLAALRAPRSAANTGTRTQPRAHTAGIDAAAPRREPPGR